MTTPPTEHLWIKIDGESPRVVELPPARLVIGRSAEHAGLVLQGRGVADVHCAIGRTKAGGFAVKDLGSAHGTLVNGKKIDTAALHAGDVIQLGDQRLHVVDASERPKPPPPPAAKDAHAPSVKATEPAPSTPKIPNYTIQRVLGRGGMGQVYLAKQESLDRKVALKVLSPKLEADADFVRRFLAEARAAAALNHPNVVTVYDVGEVGGTHYLSMEYMERGNLEDALARRGRIAWREVLDILRDAAAGLVYAEAKRIVHRDIKPANLMQNHVGATKIADLGLATHIEAEARASADTKIFGTPHFMSPEQARGERVDSRSDLYSLGATAYRILTGETPFEGATSRDILRAHLRDEPRPMKEIVSDIPDPVVACVARLMKKDPAERFASAAELVREIDRIRAQTGAAHSPRAVAQSKPKRSWVGIAVVLGLVGGAAFVWSRTRDASPQPNAAPQKPASAAVDSSQPKPDAPGDAANSKNPTTPAKTLPGRERPVDDDRGLALMEANAKVALLELLNRPMDPGSRRDELRSFSVKYRGTTAATTALEKAEELGVQILSDLAAQSGRESEVSAILTKLRAEAHVGERPPRPGAALQRIRSLPGTQAFEQDPAFLSGRKEIERELLNDACDFAVQALDDIAGDMERGDFDVVAKKLQELMPVFELPDFPMGHAPSGTGTLYELARRARERLNNLALVRENYKTQRARGDQVEIVKAFGGPSGLEAELRRFDFAAARKRISELEPKVAADASRNLVRALAQDLADAESVLAMLGREYSKSGWRRKSFTDPRDKKNSTKVAVGADADGILCEGEPVDRVPWSAFGGDTKEVYKLFNERLVREYTAGEHRAIGVLLRLCAVTEALELGAKMLEPRNRSTFTEANSKEITECFAPASSWAEKSPSGTALAREIEAASLFARTLLLGSQNAYSEAVAGAERLLRTYPDTLLVRLMSDGTPIEPDPPPPAAGAPATPPPTATAPATDPPAAPKPDEPETKPPQ